MKHSILSRIIPLAALLMMPLATVSAQTGDVDELFIGRDVTTVPVGSKADYLRVRLERTVKAGEWTAFTLPAKLDGYYFGPDAERYLIDDITYGTDGKQATVACHTLYDTTDFAAGKMYLVKSTIDLTEITCLTPGIPTAVVQNQDLVLACLQLDDPNLQVGITTPKADSEAATAYDLCGRIIKGTGAKGIVVTKNKKYIVR